VPTKSSLVRNYLSRSGRALLLLLLTFAWVSCGDIYRPVANPILPPGGQPQAIHYAIVVGANGTLNGGAATVDVSGDTNMGNAIVGVNPVHASLYFTSSVAVTNQGSDSVSIYFPSSPTNTVTTINLPPGSAPVYSAQNATNIYVADYGLNQVAIINSALKAATSFVNVGLHPVGVAVTPDNTRIYCINQGDGTVTVISALDSSIVTTIPVGHNPVWGAMRSDGAFFYVVNQADGTVSVIDTGAQAVVATLSVGTSPSGIYYDSNLARLYVANTGSNTVSVFNANSAAPTLLATVTTGVAPIAVTALSNGSKFYVANSVDNTVSVFNALNFAAMTTIPVGTNPVWIAASPDATKVYTPNKGSGTVSIINTTTDTVSVNLATPSSAPSFVAISQ